MLVAPFALTEPGVGSRKPSARRRTSDPRLQIVPLWLIAWALLGTIAVFIFPALRGGEIGGLTVPFWLAAAPWIIIVWLTQSRWSRFFRRAWQARFTNDSRAS